MWCAGPATHYTTQAERGERRDPWISLALATQRLAQANVPAPAVAASIGRIAALEKPNGRCMRAVVVGDALCRLIGRTLAQAFVLRCEEALPH